VTSRPWVSIWLSPLALSPTALVWATAIGAFSTLVLVPGTSGAGLFTWQWLAVVVGSQAVFAAIIIAVRCLSPTLGPILVLVTLAVSGACRGVVIATGAGLIGLNALTGASLVGRAVNSAVISVIGVSLIGATLAWRADFRAQYRMLRDRAILIGTAAHDGRVIAPAVLDAWTTMKGDLDASLKAARNRLAAGATQRDLHAAADLLTSTIDMRLRPAAHAMWQEAIPKEEPIRLRALFVDTIARWRPPLKVILGFLAVVVGVGSIMRSGLVDGGAYTVRYIIVTGLILWLSTVLARTYPQRSSVIALVTLALLPPLVLLSDYVIGDALLGLPKDPIGQEVVAVQTPITTVLIAMAVQAVRDRQQVLASLQARIDIEAADLRRRTDHTDRDAQRLSLFVHHSVQSELSALAMQVREAASTGDVITMDEVRLAALDRLQRLEALDAHSPPWLEHPGGRDRIAQVVDAWTGILDIRVDLPEQVECRSDQWHLAAQVVEEGLANSARHGGAGHVTISAHWEADVLVLRIADDGTDARRAGQPLPGLGTQWLDRVAPGDWTRKQTAAGALLTVRIR
jgi:signal transduction histidine kinase